MQTTPPESPRKTRPGFVIAGALAALVAVALMLGGGAALYVDGQKDSQGYVPIDGDSLSTNTAALVSENLDVDLDGAGFFFDHEEFGQFKLSADPAGDERVFVGIARTKDVERYLGGVARQTIADAGFGPFDEGASLRSEGGKRRATPPGAERFWVASARGFGEQTLSGDLRDGEWSVVVMNADGSPGVDVELDAAAKVPWLEEIGWSVLGGGILVGAGAALLLLAGFRGPRDPGTAPAAPAPTAVTATA
jgi:hypothetical protein